MAAIRAPRARTPGRPVTGGADVREIDPVTLEATLEIAYRGIRQAFTTSNVYAEPARIDMRLIDGPFSQLQGCWLFRELRADACKVEFTLEYAFASGLLGKALSPVFAQIAGSMVDAFVRRAQAIHG